MLIQTVRSLLNRKKIDEDNCEEILIKDFLRAFCLIEINHEELFTPSDSEDG